MRLVGVEQNGGNGPPRQLWACGAQCVEAAKRRLGDLSQTCLRSLSQQCADAAGRGEFHSGSDCESAIGLPWARSEVEKASPARFPPATIGGWRSHHTIIVLLLMNLAGLGGAFAMFVVVRRQLRGGVYGVPAVAYIAPKT